MTNGDTKSHGRRNLFMAAAIMIAAFLLGFVPQFRGASQLRVELRAREQRIEQLEREAKLSRGRELASLLHLALMGKNYGIAAQHATAFFDHVRGMMTDTSSPASRSTLENVVNQRDAIVANIAKPDPAVETQVREILERMHQLTEP